MRSPKNWYEFWVRHSSSLQEYLRELREIEAEGVGEDIETSKGQVIRRKATRVAS